MQLDKELQADIVRELEWEPKVDSANIGLAVDKGAVTLTGHVNTYTELIAAERAALRVYGVLAVANELVVKLPSDRTRDDSDIALAISNQMAWNAAIPHEAVKAKVTHGWVTLEGRVDWAYQSEAANKLVRGLAGVKGVTNRLIVQPAPHYKDVKAKITEALHGQAQIEARRIWLTTDDGHVTLHGQVSSWSEASAARKAAESAPGRDQSRQPVDYHAIGGPVRLDDPRRVRRPAARLDRWVDPAEGGVLARLAARQKASRIPLPCLNRAQQSAHHRQASRTRSATGQW